MKPRRLQLVMAGDLKEKEKDGFLSKDNQCKVPLNIYWEDSLVAPKKQTKVFFVVAKQIRFSS